MAQQPQRVGSGLSQNNTIRPLTTNETPKSTRIPVMQAWDTMANQ